MPGSPKACREHFAVIAPVLDHAIETLAGEAFELLRLTNSIQNEGAAAESGASSDS